VGCDQYLEMYEAIELESINNNCLDFHSPVENLDSNLRAIQHSIGVNRVVASSCSGLMESRPSFSSVYSYHVASRSGNVESLDMRLLSVCRYPHIQFIFLEVSIYTSGPYFFTY